MFSRLIISFVLVLLTSYGIHSNASQQGEMTNPVLSSNATLDEVIAALETAHTRYETLYIQVREYDHLSNSIMTDTLWLSQPQGAYRWQLTSQSAGGEISESLSVSNGQNFYTTLGFDGQPITTSVVIEPAYVVKTLGLLSTVIAPEVVAQRLADPTARVEIADTEIVQSRETIKVMYASEWRAMNLWIDTETGILLQHEIWTLDNELTSTVVVEAVEFDPVFEDPASLFYVDASAYSVERLRAIFAQLTEGR